MMQKLAEVETAIQQLTNTRRELQESLESFNGGCCQQAALECGCDCLSLGT